MSCCLDSFGLFLAASAAFVGFGACLCTGRFLCRKQLIIVTDRQRSGNIAGISSIPRAARIIVKRNVFTAVRLGRFYIIIMVCAAALTVKLGRGERIVGLFAVIISAAVLGYKPEERCSVSGESAVYRKPDIISAGGIRGVDAQRIIYIIAVIGALVSDSQLFQKPVCINEFAWNCRRINAVIPALVSFVKRPLAFCFHLHLVSELVGDSYRCRQKCAELFKAFGIGIVAVIEQYLFIIKAGTRYPALSVILEVEELYCILHLCRIARCDIGKPCYNYFIIILVSSC